MSTTPPIEAVIRRVAEGLGLPPARAGADEYWTFMLRKDRWCVYYGRDGSMITVAFAAYAEAEMAKRGWRTVPGYGAAHGCPKGMVSMHKMMPGFGIVVTALVPCDHGDPISKAHAVLRCCAEALELDARQHGCGDAAREGGS